MTYDDIKRMEKAGSLVMHHQASARGYVSRKPDVTPFVSPYMGIFGDGYTVAFPRYDTTGYYYLVYYIEA